MDGDEDAGYGSESGESQWDAAEDDDGSDDEEDPEGPD